MYKINKFSIVNSYTKLKSSINCIYAPLLMITLTFVQTISESAGFKFTAAGKRL